MGKKTAPSCTWDGLTICLELTNYYIGVSVIIQYSRQGVNKSIFWLLQKPVPSGVIMLYTRPYFSITHPFRPSNGYTLREYFNSTWNTVGFSWLWISRKLENAFVDLLVPQRPKRSSPCNCSVLPTTHCQWSKNYGIRNISTPPPGTARPLRPTSGLPLPRKERALICSVGRFEGLTDYCRRTTL